MLRIPYTDTSINADAALTLALVPLWWFSGLTIAIYQLIAVFLLMKLAFISSRTRQRIRIPPEMASLLVLVAIYLASLVCNALFRDPSRVVASSYNLSIWVSGICVWLAVHNLYDLSDLRPLRRVLGWLVLALFCLCALGAWKYLQGNPWANRPTLLLGLMPGVASTALLEAALNISLVRTDWFAGLPAPRAMVFSPYPTALGALMVLLIPLATALWRLEGRPLRATWTGLLGCAVLVASLSRGAVAGLCGGVLLLILLKARWSKPVLVLLLLMTLPLVPYGARGVSEMREDSSSSRLGLYQETVEVVSEESPVLGIGVKPRPEGAGFPIGSHSTYLGILLRTGILGLAAFVLFQFQLLWAWYRSRKRALPRHLAILRDHLGVALAAMAVVMLIDDVDAQQLVSFLYFLVVGLFVLITGSPAMHAPGHPIAPQQLQES